MNGHICNELRKIVTVLSKGGIYILGFNCTVYCNNLVIIIFSLICDLSSCCYTQFGHLFDFFTKDWFRFLCSSIESLHMMFWIAEQTATQHSHETVYIRIPQKYHVLLECKWLVLDLKTASLARFKQYSSPVNWFHTLQCDLFERNRFEVLGSI